MFYRTSVVEDSWSCCDISSAAETQSQKLSCNREASSVNLNVSVVLMSFTVVLGGELAHLCLQVGRCNTGSQAPSPPPPCSSTPAGWCWPPAGCSSPCWPGCSNTPSAPQDEPRGGGLGLTLEGEWGLTIVEPAPPF